MSSGVLADYSGSARKYRVWGFKSQVPGMLIDRFFSENLIS